MNILAIESSCDETACAFVKDGTEILSSKISSSMSMQEKWGGIVPEIAARQQLLSMIPVLTETIQPLQKKAGTLSVIPFLKKYIDAVAVTVGPGLIGSLLVGIETAKATAYLINKPIIPVNHVLAHIYVNMFAPHTLDSATHKNPMFPAIALVVSGGHTELYYMKSQKHLKWLGGTVDDAAGECFDKSARIIGLGAGGGQAIERTSSEYYKNNDRPSQLFPRPMMYDGTLNFSFSGLKTAVIREWNKQNDQSQKKRESVQSFFANEIQEAITDVLVYKTIQAKTMYNARSVLISGGVAANKRLNEKFSNTCREHNVIFFSPSPLLCTDNAAVIGSYAFFRGKPVCWKDVEAEPDMDVEVAA